MKRTLLLSVLAVMATWQAMAAGRISVKPEFLYRNSFAYLRPDTVVMTDTATTLSLWVIKSEDFFFFSSETCLRDRQGHTYPLRRIISDYGLQPDEPMLFAKLGKTGIAVKLVFPPLPDDVVEVDLTDPQFHGRGLFGIRLDGSPLPPFRQPDLMPEAMARQDSLPAVDTRFGWATVKGHLMEYRPGMATEMTLVIGSSVYRSPQRSCDTLSAQVSPSGDFCFRFPVTHIAPVIVEVPLPHGGARSLAYVGPDAETEVYVNMREIAQRHTSTEAKLPSKLYVTRGPLAQLSNELNRHMFWHELDYVNKYFKTIFTNRKEQKEWNRFKEIRAMMPTKQLEVRLAELDTLKADEQWSPAMKELARLDWQLRKAIQVNLNIYTSNQIEREAKESPKVAEELAAWKRDAVVAELNSYNLLRKNPKQVYSPVFLQSLELIRTGSFMPEYIANEKTAWGLREQMLDFSLLNPNEIADNLNNLPPAYRQWVLTWQDIYREEHDRLAGTEMVCDTIQGIADTLVVKWLSERYRGHTLFIHFYYHFNPSDMKDVLLPLQRELADRDIVWINIYSGPKMNRTAFSYDYANWLRYGTRLQGELYYLKRAGTVERTQALNRSMGINRYINNETFCIVSPDGKIVRNNEDSPNQQMENDYLGIRHCLQQTAKMQAGTRRPLQLQRHHSKYKDTGAGNDEKNRF